MSPPDRFAGLVAAQSAQRAAAPAPAALPPASPTLTADEVRDLVADELVGMMLNRPTRPGRRRGFTGAIIR